MAMYIPTQQAVPGAAVVHANAVSLLESAKALRDLGKFGHATALAILAAEESSKALALLSHAQGEQPSEVLRDAFSKHKIKISIARLNAKNMQALLAETGLFPQLATHESVSEQIAHWVEEWAGKANELKQAGLYVSYDHGSWIAPHTVTQDHCKNSFFIAALGLLAVAATLPKYAS